jgi:two-component system sensor kinase FixL
MREITEILTDIVSEDKRASEIIQRMREFIKKGPIKLEPVNINDVVKKAVALERSDLITRNIIIKTDMANDLPLALADSVQVIQVLLNLIINACDAMQSMPANERLLYIKTEKADEESLSISVADRGKGVLESELECIFDPFFTSKPDGLGLGLTICRSVIEAHRGRLWVENNRSGGATFNFALPIFKKMEVAVE